jgi:DNA polymerase III epsilon subunit family exonuclease
MKWYEKGPFVVFDLETTGLSPSRDAVVEIAAVRVDTNGKEKRFSSLVNPERKIPARASQVHGIYYTDVINAPTFETAGRNFLDFAEGAILVAHNAKFDLAFLQESLNRYNLPLWEGNTLDSIAIIKAAYPGLPKYNLQSLRKYFDLGKHVKGPAHRAFADVEWTVEIFAMSMQSLIDIELQQKENKQKI